MKKGDVVYSSGQGKTKEWNQVKGIITKVEKDKIYVKWNNTSFEDEMDYDEVLELDLNQLLRFSDGVDIFTGGEYLYLILFRIINSFVNDNLGKN